MRRFRSQLETNHTRRRSLASSNRTSNSVSSTESDVHLIDKTTEICALKVKLVKAEVSLKDLKTTKEKLVTAEKTIKALEAKLRSRLKAVESLEATKKRLETAENAIKYFEKTRSGEVSENLSTIQELSNKLDEHKLEEKRLKEELTEVMRLNEKFKIKQVHFEGLSKKRSAQLEASEQLVGNIKNKLALSKVELTASAKEIDTLKKKLKDETDQFKGRIEELASQLTEKEKKEILLKGQLKSRSLELREANKELVRVKILNEKLETMNKTQSKKIKTLEWTFSTLRTNADSMLTEVTTLRAEAIAAKTDLNKLNKLDLRPVISEPESANGVILKELEKGVIKTGTLIASYEKNVTLRLKSHEKKVKALTRKIDHIRTQLELKAVDNAVRERSLYETNNIIQRRQKSRIVQLMKEVELHRNAAKS